MESETMKHSHSILAQLVLPMQANPAGNVHGGEIMKMMDSAAGLRHRNTPTQTLSPHELTSLILKAECLWALVNVGHRSYMRDVRQWRSCDGRVG